MSKIPHIPTYFSAVCVFAEANLEKCLFYCVAAPDCRPVHWQGRHIIIWNNINTGTFCQTWDMKVHQWPGSSSVSSFSWRFLLVMVCGAVVSERFSLKSHFVLQLISTKSTKKLSGKLFLGEREERGLGVSSSSRWLVSCCWLWPNAFSIHLNTYDLIYRL